MKAFLANVVLTGGLLWISSCSDKNGADAETMRSDGALETARGDAYANGAGVEKDAAEAVKWYRKAAEKGYPRAQLILGLSYDQGNGVEKDVVEAVKWYRKAAEKGSAEAQFMLGFSYDQGDGVEKDVTEAVKWWRKAAENGYPRAQLNLGFSYDLGNGVEKDVAEAYAWYNLAAVKMPPAAKFRDDMEKFLSPEVISAAQKRSKELREQIDARMKEGN